MKKTIRWSFIRRQIDLCKAFSIQFQLTIETMNAIPNNSIINN